ncbi:hypothetical protein ACOSP7_009741 [Xanthoceras sorbifolium]
MMDNLSFSSSVSEFQRQACSGTTTTTTTSTNQSFQFQVEKRQTDLSSKLGVNGRPSKMVPVSEVMKGKTPSNGKVDTMNGSKQNVNRSTLVKRNYISGLVRTPKGRDLKELPPFEELKVLPSEKTFS